MSQANKNESRIKLITPENYPFEKFLEDQEKLKSDQKEKNDFIFKVLLQAKVSKSDQILAQENLCELINLQDSYRAKIADLTKAVSFWHNLFIGSLNSLKIFDSRTKITAKALFSRIIKTLERLKIFNFFGTEDTLNGIPTVSAFMGAYNWRELPLLDKGRGKDEAEHKLFARVYFDVIFYFKTFKLDKKTSKEDFQDISTKLISLMNKNGMIEYILEYLNKKPFSEKPLNKFFNSYLLKQPQTNQSLALLITMYFFDDKNSTDMFDKRRKQIEKFSKKKKK